MFGTIVLVAVAIAVTLGLFVVLSRRGLPLVGAITAIALWVMVVRPVVFPHVQWGIFRSFSSGWWIALVILILVAAYIVANALDWAGIAIVLIVVALGVAIFAPNTFTFGSSAGAKPKPLACSPTQAVQNSSINGQTVSKCVAIANDTANSVKPVARPMSTWQQVIAYGNAHPSYVTCFQQVTGHPWSDAYAADAKQKAGWHTTVLIESNITDQQANAVLASHRLVKDSVVRSVNGFINSRTTDCTEFQDNSSQAREALTFPGKNKSTPGEVAVLELCGNPVGRPGAAVNKVVLLPGTTTVTSPPHGTPRPGCTSNCSPPSPTPSPTPGCTSNCTPNVGCPVGTHGTPGSCVKNCYKVSCGGNGVNAPSVQAGNPGGTPNYTAGTAETVGAAQSPPASPYSPNPTYGSNPQPGSSAPAGGDNGTATGGSAGVSAPSGTPNPGGGTAQPSTSPTAGSTGSSGNPCYDPNAPGCGH